MRFHRAVLDALEARLNSGLAQPPIERVLIVLCANWGVCLALNPELMGLAIFAPDRAYMPVWTWSSLALMAAGFEIAGLTLRRFGQPHWLLRWLGLTLMTAFWVGLVERYIAAGIHLAPWLGLNAVFAWLSFLNSARLFLHRPRADARDDAA